MAANPESLRNVLSKKDLLWLSGEQAFLKGQDLFSAGKILFKAAGAGHLQATVTDVSSSYPVDIRLLRNNDIHYACDCAPARLELFCAHCVACSLAWLSETFDATDLWSEAMSAISEIDEIDSLSRQLQACLQQMERHDLIDTLIEWAKVDPAHAQELLNSQRFAPFL